MKKNEDDQTRVAPSVPCVETAGSTAEKRTGAVTAAEQPGFLYQVLDVIALGELCDEVWWHSTGGEKPPMILVNCNDFFYWGCADCEPITPSNLHHLRAAIAECDAVPDYEGSGWEASLFCAKARGLRPQGCCYPKHAGVAALFDACGPKRDIDLGNPYAHPNDGGKYEYRQSCGQPEATNAIDPVEGSDHGLTPRAENA